MVSIGSPKRSWLHVAALGLVGLVLCAAGPGQQIPQNQREGADGAHQSEHQDGRAAPATVQKPKQTHEGQGNADKSKDDQPSKALAEANMWATIIQAGFSFLGLVGLGVTIEIARRAWKEAQRSADAAHRSIDDAIAGAAEQEARFLKQFDVATAAALAAEKAAEAAEAALIAQNPPKLVVRRLDVLGLAKGRPVEISGIVANVGGSVATVIESNFTVAFMPGDRLPATPPMIQTISPLSGDVHPGPGVPFKAVSIHPMVEPEYDIIVDPAQIGLLLVGYIAYRDQRGVDRYMSFGRRYDAQAHRFRAVDDENYEYSQ